MSNRPLAVDLFAGAGGLSLGLEEAGFDVAAAIEFDPVHAAVHKFNFPDSATLCIDARKVTGGYIRQHSCIGNRDIALVAGGPPCQGFSTIGKRAIEDPRNELLGEFVRLVGELNPRYFLMENVSGLAIGDHRHILDEIVTKLVDLGYKVQPYKILQAADYGTPQSRRRLILIGARQDSECPSYPPAVYFPRRTDGVEPSVSSELPLGPSVMDAIGDLPDADCFPQLLSGDSISPVEYKRPSRYASMLRDPENDKDNFSAPRVFDASALTNSARTRHTPTSIERFRATTPGTTEKVSRFLRLHPQGISNTLRAGTASDHGAHTAPRPIHPVFPRVITVREAARLHGYPDWFRFHSTKWNGFREIGNSVPIPLGRSVGASILSAGGWTACKPLRVLRAGDERLLHLTQSQAERFWGINDRVIPQRKRS